MLAYACTIFLSAFLLFEVQPMIGKIILPWFGGSAAVWSTCLLFFQTALVAGYLYAHWSTRFLRPKRQAVLHVGLLALSLALLPILPSPNWKPAHAGDPSLRILLLLASTIGLPYILLSTTSPLLQAWYVAARPKAVPYRLFALSNLGSLIALFSFPVFVEPLLTTHAQAYSWSAIYAIFVALCAVIAVRMFRMTSAAVATAVINDELPPAPPTPGMTILMWIALPACASTLLVALTNHLSQNVAPIPFLWTLCLGVYLISFILCFEREKLYHRAVFLPLLAVALGAMAFAIYADQGNPTIWWALPTFVAGLFVCCMVCHGELVRVKPDPRHLTSFYLMVSLGGALGGLFVAIIAPHVFHSYIELPIAIIVCAVLVDVALWMSDTAWTGRIDPRLVRIAMMVPALALAGYIVYQEQGQSRLYSLSVRNFYGALKVRDMPKTKEEQATRVLVHGTISHGSQILDPDQRRAPTSYYGQPSGLGRSIRHFQKLGPVRIGVIGLGAGVTASYCRAGDLFQFYEINPLDLNIATTWFTFLNDCPGEHKVLLGDARLTLERHETDQQLDVLAVDAFTSDAIPVHLLTREAFALYFRHIKPGGILAVHVSNRYLDLIPVVAQNARDLGKTAINVSDDEDDDSDYLSSSDWVLVSANALVFRNQLFQISNATPAKPRPGLRAWTDNYSNLFQILK
jgi:hypothetical protein